MFTTFSIAAALAMALQTTGTEPPPVVIEDFAQLPVEEAAAPRCGVVFAVVMGQQQAGEAQAKEWPDLASTNGREFFVRAMAKLMDQRGLDQGQVEALSRREAARLSGEGNKRLDELMPPCLLMKQAAGL